MDFTEGTGAIIDQRYTVKRLQRDGGGGWWSVAGFDPTSWFQNVFFLMSS